MVAQLVKKFNAFYVATRFATGQNSEPFEEHSTQHQHQFQGLGRMEAALGGLVVSVLATGPTGYSVAG
jgi:hypothetical protein